MLRQRSKKAALKVVKQLDAFPKVPEKCVETSPVGGTLSVLTVCVILALVYAEFSYYLSSRFIFKFLPDTDFDAKLKINIDLTIAMPCNTIGADILDSTNQNVLQFGSLEQEDTWFDLSPEQRQHFDEMRQVNSYLREEFHAIQDLLWRSGQSSLFGEMPKRTVKPDRPPDSCRVFGTLVLNKVAGNFHITAGRSISLPRGHVHVSAFISNSAYNFSHRINRFSFGDPSPGIVHPLEGDEKVSGENMMLYQYFVDVVPTDVDTFLTSLTTYQYSVKDHERPIDHNKGSHGIPGIFFKYDMSALKVRVTQERDSLGQFIVRLCASVGGIYVTSGIINNMLQFLANLITGKREGQESGAAAPLAGHKAPPRDARSRLPPVTILPDKMEPFGKIDDPARVPLLVATGDNNLAHPPQVPQNGIESLL